MADFSVSETSLSAPQGAGSAAVQAVQTAAPVTEGFMQTVGTIADVFSKGLLASRKSDALKAQQTVVNGYIQEITAVNDALMGGMPPAKAKMHSQVIFNKYMASYGSQYGEELDKAAKIMRGQTQLDEAEDQVKTEKARRESNKTLAINRGYTFYPGMSQQAEDATFESAQAGVRTEHQMAAIYKESAERRAQAGFDAELQVKLDKKASYDTLNMLAGSNVTSFQALAKDLGDQVRKGMPQETAQALLGERYTNILSSIDAAAGLHPELASARKASFTEIYNVGIKLQDTKSDLKPLQDQLEKRVLQSKLLATEDNDILSGVATNQLFANSPSIALSLNTVAVSTIEKLSGKLIEDVGRTKHVPQVIGNKEIETDVFKGLRQGLLDISSGNVTDKELAIIQSSNSVNTLLTQTGDMVGRRGTSPKQFVGIAKFVADSNYVQLLKAGKISPQAAEGANKAFKLLYQPVLVDDVETRLTSELVTGVTKAMRDTAAGAPQKGTTLGEVVNIKFAGSGIVFEPKTKAGMSPYELRAAHSEIKTLESSQAAINQLLHISSHLEGRVDYGNVWEENKHLWIPSFFPEPTKLKVGQVVKAKNGKSYKYLGGDFNDISNSYTEVGSGKSE